ncbi:MAG TPA: GTP-binding protein, partial [Firmicutes bacterium]|nr:GTP-binding protein [Candidatus Fermentithermobacillaceae bacterium]
MSNGKVINQQMCAIEKLKGRLAQNELIISVIGQFKRGKTALVNAILGDEILPVGIVPLTSVVTKIRNGNAFRAVVHFLNGSSQQVPQAELSGFISEQENKNNHKNVDFVDLWYPCNLLGQGVILVDTPGVGSVHRHNTEASYAFVQKSDAVLFVLSVDSPINELEREFLLQAERYASKFYFVVNKVDTIGDASKAEYLAYCKTVLQGILVKEPVELYPVSALTGEGVTEVLDVIRRDISSSADQILRSSICIKVNDVVQEAVSKLDLYVSAISLSIEELNEKTTSLTEKQRELDAMADQTDLLL